MASEMNDSLLCKISNTTRNYEEEAILFSKVAKIVRNEIFNKTNFSGNLNEYESRHNIPLTSNLMSMALYGKEIVILQKQMSVKC